MSSGKRFFTAVSLMVVVLVSLSFISVGYINVADGAKKEFNVEWTHYTGWEPWQLALHKGILKKWADKYGIEIVLELKTDYAMSISSFTSGECDGCVMTNMDALTGPVAGGVDCTALIFGDYSNGNDGIMVMNYDNSKSLTENLKGRQCKLQMNTVSHYLLWRWPAVTHVNINILEKDLVHTSDSDIAALFVSDPKGFVVTWNPPLMQCRDAVGAKELFNSSQIPGEIIDLMVVHTDTPAVFKKALVGAWYETMTLMSGKTKGGKDAIKYMANFAGGTQKEFERQLATTAMFYTPQAALRFIEEAQLKKTMKYVTTFCAGRKLIKEDAVGILLPDGSIMGNSKNVKFRFDTSYTKMVAEGKL